MYQKKLNSGNYGAGLLIQINDILQQAQKPLTVMEIYEKLNGCREPKRTTFQRIRTAAGALIKAGKVDQTEQPTKNKTRIYLYQWKQQ